MIGYDIISSQPTNGTTNPRNMATKLTPAQARTLAQITEAQPSTPDKVTYGAWLQVDDWSCTIILPNGEPYARLWNGNRVYGTFNTATLKSLEKKGLIRVHRFGGSWMTDEIEVLAA